MELRLVGEKNGTQIISKLKELYNQTTIDRRFLLEFLGNFRAIIANYLRTNYALDPLALENKLNLIAVDECLFSYIEGS